MVAAGVAVAVLRIRGVPSRAVALAVQDGSSRVQTAE